LSVYRGRSLPYLEKDYGLHQGLLKVTLPGERGPPGGKGPRSRSIERRGNSVNNRKSRLAKARVQTCMGGKEGRIISSLDNRNIVLTDNVARES